MEELDQEQKEQGLLFVKGVMFRVRTYMAEALRYANHQAELPDEVFWRNLFLPTQKASILRREDGKDPDRCPQRPYAELDFQACVKYLLFGGERLLPGENGGYATDSLNFLNTFGLTSRPRASGGRRPGPPYNRVLSAAIMLRNDKNHEDLITVEEVSVESMRRDLDKLEKLTEPMARKEGWTELQPLPDYWRETRDRLQQMFGYPPVRLEEVGQEIFLSDEARLTQEQRQALEEAAAYLRLEQRGGKVYGEDRQALKKRLTAAPGIAALLGVRGSGPARRTEGDASRPREKEGRPEAIPAEAAALLRRSGSVLPLQRAVLTALLDSFTLLVDESLFLAPEGRELLNERLAPLLMRRKARLQVDESVVNALFQSFRSSAPCSPLELSELALSGMESDQIEELQAQRREEHRNSKTAIKTLRYLRQRGCLEVIFSPTDSVHSYDNIRWVASSFPAVRFLVLTMDRQLAGELGDSRNAAAAKPGLDGQLLIYRASKPCWQALLEGEPGAAPAVPERPREERPAPPAEIIQTSGAAKQLLSVGELPKTGSTVTAVWPDGTRRELRLGRQLGREGGEGTVYTLGGLHTAAAKIYHRNQLTGERQEKLRHMVRLSPDIPGLCWPQALVFNSGGEWTGFLMPRVEAKELCQTVYKPGRDNRTIKALNWDRKSLALIAANTAATFAKMHQRGILMGDINPRNFMVGPDCSVYFVDCDSYQFERFPCPVRSDRYTPPEILRAVKRSGQENYNYIRTLDHERYSMAVVLFEILMLGKSPYESRNTDSENVLDAIMDGNFPYPFRVAGEEGARRTDQAPAGRWREIWSHMTYQVKSGFYSTFTGNSRQSAEDWERTLREYIRQIELGHSSSALTPEGFKDVDGTLLKKTCSECGTPYTVDEETYQRRSGRGEPDLCPTHYIMYHNFQGRKHRDFCQVCGAPFESPVSVWMERRQGGRPMLCPNCVNTTARCSSCGRDYAILRDRLDELRGKNIALLCPECLERERPVITCEGEGCSRVFRTSRQKMEQMHRSGRPVLCPDCLARMRG